MDIESFVEKSIELENLHRTAADTIAHLRKSVVLRHLMGLPNNSRIRFTVIDAYRPINRKIQARAEDGTLVGKLIGEIKVTDIPKHYNITV